MSKCSRTMHGAYSCIAPWASGRSGAVWSIRIRIAITGRDPRPCSRYSMDSHPGPRHASGRGMGCACPAAAFPDMLDEKCGLRSYAGWSLPTWVTKELALAPLLNRLEADWQQVECVHARVLSLVDRLDQRLGPTNVRVLIHGDHGARLAKRRIRPKAERLQAATPDASLDTLVLVRAPGMTAGVNADRIRLADSIRSSYDALLR